MVEGHPERGGVQGPQQLHADRQAVEELLRPRDQLHADVVPGLSGCGSPRADHVDPGHLRQRRRRCSAASENGGNWSAGVAADIYQKYRIDLKYSGYFGDYSTTPTAATPAVASWACPTAPTHRCPIAVGSRSRSRPRSRRTRHVSQTLLAAGFAALLATGALAAVSGRRGEAARHDADAGRRRRRPATRTARFPSTPAGSRRRRDFKEGSGFRPDPYASEKPRLVITGKDVAAHADKLTEGTKELLKRYPTMRVDVYPTHRTVALPQRVLDNTVKNATGAKSIDGGLGVENVLAGYPFPIPKTGDEAMWNHLLRYNGLGYDDVKYENWNVDSAGVPTLATSGELSWTWPIYDPKKTGTISAADPYWQVKLTYTGPARRAGEALLLIDSVNPLKQGTPRVAVPARPAPREARAGPRLRHAESRLPPARRRTTTSPSSTARWTASTGSSSARRRCTSRTAATGSRTTRTRADVTKPNHINPDLVRWELHRVWVVEATLKEGKRHIYAQAHLLPRRGQLARRRLRPVRRARAALPVELRAIRRTATTCRRVRRHDGDLRLQLGPLRGHRPVRAVQRAQVHDRAAEGNA